MRSLLPVLLALLLLPFAASGEDDLGNLSANPYDPDSVSNPYGAGNPHDPNSVTNPYGPYGSPYSNQSANNPYATDAPKLYDSQGNYRGKLSSNPHDPDSVSNPYCRYGNPYSPESLNNPYGAGNPYRPDSPNNPYGSGWDIVGGDNNESEPDSYTPPLTYPAPSTDYDSGLGSYQSPYSGGYESDIYGSEDADDGYGYEDAYGDTGTSDGAWDW